MGFRFAFCQEHLIMCESIRSHMIPSSLFLFDINSHYLDPLIRMQMVITVIPSIYKEKYSHQLFGYPKAQFFWDGQDKCLILSLHFLVFNMIILLPGIACNIMYIHQIYHIHIHNMQRHRDRKEPDQQDELKVQ